MAQVKPIKALSYEQDIAGPIAQLLAPPYDVIDASERQRLLRLSPHNAVVIDLPEPPAKSPQDRYAFAAQTVERWIKDGVLVHDEPALWALTQDYLAPDGSQHRRNSIIARVRVEDYGPGRIRPHERTQPGPKQDRLELTRATRLNLSPIFSLTSRDAWPLLAETVAASRPWGEAEDADGTINRIWRLADPALHEAVATELEAAELLIADGHHRYETARTYAAEIGGEGAHEFTLMALTGLEDPGLTVFPTHRLLSGLADSGRLAKLEAGLAEIFDVEEVSREALDPVEESDIGCFGYIEAGSKRNLRLRLRDPQRISTAMSGRSAAYRELDAAILETLVLGGILGMSEADVEAKRGIGYAKSIQQTVDLLESSAYDAAFILRATPIEQVQAIAAAGENMPPKSTYFYPKIPTGIVFNPLTES